ncbi:MAG: alpha/beta hydrolase family esterase [Myxococcota bacterium]
MKFRLHFLVVLLCFTTACDGTRGGQRVSDAGADAAEQAPTFSLEPGVHEGSLVSGDFERTFLIDIPPSYDGSTDIPLLFVFHGGGGSGEKIQGRLGFGAAAEPDGAIVVYPDGIESNWADGRGTTDASRAGVDDVRFVSELIDHLDAHLSIDESRVWATGVSNGGIFSHTLACDLAGRIAAVGPVISAFPTEYKDDCSPARPIPMLAIQGTEDPFMTFEGGDASHDERGLGAGGAIESAEATADFWAQKNGCDPEPNIRRLEPVDPDDPTRVELWEFRNCEGGAQIDYYIVEGMGHTWPPLEARFPRLSGPTSPNINATGVIWRFFQDKQLE